MAFEYLEHEADVGIKATADTLEEAFEDGAKAMFNTMVDIARVEPLHKMEVEASADSADSLFVEFLNKLLSKADTKGMVFSQFRVKITKRGGKYSLKASAWGEPLDRKRHDVKTEVKAATYSGLKCWSDSGKHNVQCVLDL
jgi:SHS2 domain-containing protein